MRSIECCLVALMCLWPVGAPARPQAEISLAERAQFEALCADLVPIERMHFGDSEPIRAAARASYAERQRVRRAERYSVELAWSDFFVSSADAPDGALDLLMDRPFALFGGSVTLFDLGRDGLLFVPAAGESALDRLRSALKRGALRLTLHFRVAAEEQAPCSKSKLGNLALSIDLLQAELRDEGRVLAVAVGPGIEGPARAGRPALTLRAVRGEAPGSVPAIIEGLAPQRAALESCYTQSLTASPGIEGMIAYDLKSNAEGRLETSIAVADSLQSPMLESCVMAVLKSARIPPQLQGTLVLEFSLRAEASAGKSGK